MMLYVDSREPAVLQVMFKAIHLPVEVKTLESGDYVFGDVGIERKQTNDLMCSLFTKTKKGNKLWRQLGNLKRTYKHPFLLIEGAIDWDDISMASVVTTVLIRFEIPIINTYDKKDTVSAITKFYNKYGMTSAGIPPPPCVVRRQTSKEIRWGMVQCIPGIGAAGAKRLMDEIPNLFRIAMNKEILEMDLARVKGIRRDSKEMLVRVLTE